MPFDAGQAKLIEDWFRAKFGKPVCKLCDGPLAVDPELIRLPFAGRQLQDTGAARLAVEVKCQGCGHLQLFDATVVGVVILR